MDVSDGVPCSLAGDFAYWGRDRAACKEDQRCSPEQGNACAAGM
jgi:hypothetical protein